MSGSFSKNDQVIVLVALIRIILITLTWWIARSSYVFTISVELQPNFLGNQLFILGLIIITTKAVLAVIIEVIFTTELGQQSPYLMDPSYRRLRNANIILIISEVLLLANLVLELNQLQSINFVRSIISTGSLFGILMNQSGYLIFWFAILAYVLGMIIYLFPKEDNQQADIDKMAVLLFLRSVLLPI